MYERVGLEATAAAPQPPPWALAPYNRPREMPTNPVMKRYIANVAICAGIAAACQAVALAWTGPGDADQTFLRPTILAVAVAASLFGTAVGVIAWQSREWSPAMLALGCISMAIGAVSRVVFGDAGLGLGATAAAGWMPLLGMILGGCWFFLAVQTYWPTGGRKGLASRGIMIAGVGVVVGMCGLLAFVQTDPPSQHASRILAATVAPGYLYAAYRFYSVWRFLRLPSQLAMAIGSAMFAPATIVAAAGGVPGLQPWQIEVLMVCAASLPVTGFIIEQRARPGMRTMVYSLFFPGALASFRRGYPKAIPALVERIGGHDGALRGHVDRVAELSVRLALSLGLDAATVREVMLSAQLHDLGKLYVPRAILNKPGQLDEHEWQIMRAHSDRGAEMIARIDELAGAERGVREHHERWSGGGYPSGIRGEAISRAARIIAVADVYDALRSVRAYKRSWNVSEALSQIERASGSDFDPRVVEALARLVANGAAEIQPAAQPERRRHAA